MNETTTATKNKPKTVWLVCWYEDNYVECPSKKEAFEEIKRLIDEGIPSGDIEVYEAIQRKVVATIEIV
jgi:hypothetical protein